MAIHDGSTWSSGHHISNTLFQHQGVWTSLHILHISEEREQIEKSNVDTSQIWQKGEICFAVKRCLRKTDG